MKITGADIPPELFERILDKMRHPNSAWPKRTNDVNTSKHEFANCALVCRYWSRPCQVRIFDTIRLCSHSDLAQLHAFLDSPYSLIRNYIRGIRIEMELTKSDGGPPWLHLLPTLHHKLRWSFLVHMDVRGPLPSSRKSLHSIHWTLPRACPAFSSQIFQLHLHGIHFRYFKHLVYLLQELRELWTLSCTAVTWGDEAPLLHLPPGRPRELKLQKIMMSRCTMDLSAIPLLLGMRTPVQTELSEENYVRLMQCLRAISASVEGDEITTGTETVTVDMGGGSYCDVECSWQVDASGETIHAPKVHYYPGEPGLEDFSSITFDFQADYPKSARGRHCDWAAFTRYVSEISVAKTALNFETNEIFARFIELAGGSELLQAIERRDVSCRVDFQLVEEKVLAELYSQYCTVDSPISSSGD